MVEGNGLQRDARLDFLSDRDRALHPVRPRQNGRTAPHRLIDARAEQGELQIGDGGRCGLLSLQAEKGIETFEDRGGRAGNGRRRRAPLAQRRHGRRQHP